MNQLINRIMQLKRTNNVEQNFRAGDTVSVHVRIKEGEKERIQQFKGCVIKVQGSGSSRNFTVRKISSGVGVERTFPFSSPSVSRVEVLAHGKVSRSRLFFLRGLSGRAARIESDLATAVSEDSQTQTEK